MQSVTPSFASPSPLNSAPIGARVHFEADNQSISDTIASQTLGSADAPKSVYNVAKRNVLAMFSKNGGYEVSGVKVKTTIDYKQASQALRQLQEHATQDEKRNAIRPFIKGSVSFDEGWDGSGGEKKTLRFTSISHFPHNSVPQIGTGRHAAKLDAVVDQYLKNLEWSTKK